jgi:hypothetical protein
MSESTLAITPEPHESFNPNIIVKAEILTYKSDGDLVTVSSPQVAIPIVVKTLGAWVGKNLASGIVGAAGGKIFGAAMEALGFGGPDVGALLTDISNRLVVVEKTVAEIKVLCEEILRQIEELRVTMEQYFGEAKLAEAFTEIDAAYGVTPTLLSESEPPSSSVSAPTLMELLNSLPKTKTPEQLKVYATEFVRAEEATWKIARQVVSIHDVLTSNVGQGTTLLKRWTDALLVAIKNNKITIDSAYLTLEGYFLQAIGKQLTGVAIHSFALGAEKDPSRIDYYIQQEFAPRMHAQTDEFLSNVERLVLSRTRLLKVPSAFTMEQSGEFPPEMESIFLRADLLCASLNLVGNTRNVSLKNAVAGVYGRSIARRSDLKGTQGPSITLPGFAASTGTVARAIDPLHAVDLRRDGDRLILEDYSKSAPTIVRYFLPWPGALPEQGKPVDTRFRGGVRPAYHDVFSDKDWPLAAVFVDLTPILTGAPASAPPTIDGNTLFPTGNPHTIIKQTTFVPNPTHPLVKPTNNIFEWTFEHATKAHGGWNRTTAFHLFKYNGAEAKMRLHINALCEVKVAVRQFRATIREIDLKTRVTLIHKPITGELVYDSGDEKGGVLRLANRSTGYVASVESWSQLDFEVNPGEYSLHVDFITWIGTKHTAFKGWESDRLTYILKGVYVEWL